jgi:hypothetical protein
MKCSEPIRASSKLIDEPIGRSLNRDITSGEKVEAELDFLISRRDRQRRQTEGERLEEAQLLVSQHG